MTTTPRPHTDDETGAKVKGSESFKWYIFPFVPFQQLARYEILFLSSPLLVNNKFIKGQNCVASSSTSYNLVQAQFRGRTGRR